VKEIVFVNVEAVILQAAPLELKLTFKVAGGKAVG
jgi:hypothetical protein